MEHLKEEELAEAAAGRAPLVEGKMTAAAFIKAGLQIEDAQRRIRSELSSRVHVSADRSSEIQELRFSLLQKIKTFKKLQLTYMPGVSEIRAEDDARRDPNVPPPKAENIEIYLPSGLDDTQRRGASLRGANEAEAKLRQGQCSDALVALRAALYVQAHLIAWRNVNSAGQKSATRSATLLLRVKERIERAANKYRDAWKGLRKLKGAAFAAEVPGTATGGCEREDGARNEPTQAALNAVISWIWRVGKHTGAAELHDSVRVEWMKAGARVERWREEVALLREEAKRVMRSLVATQRDWTARATRRQTEDRALANGLRAYAQRQVDFHRRVAESFWADWSKPAKAAVAEFAAEDAALLRSLLEGVDVEVLESDNTVVGGAAGAGAGAGAGADETSETPQRKRRDDDDGEGGEQRRHKRRR
ncbi:CxC2 domain-containing protein [Mycena kentingensis (nom. inval.)]|nr:CxC2 domain-containing protein [Mycena kentingensis (nom. inval.)]